MSENVIQTSFSAGELSPNLFARVDFAKYRSGAATMRNFFVDYRSGASTRPGTEFIRPTGFGDAVRLVRFQQSSAVTYVLEFGQGYLRFISNGGSVVEPGFAIAGISQNNPCFVTASNNFANGQLIFISGVTGMPQINNRYFHVANRQPNTFTLLDAFGLTPVNSIPFDPYISGGVVQRVYTIGTPYDASDLPLLKFSQNASVMNITHPRYSPYRLTLISATNWVLEKVVFGSSAPPITTTIVIATPPTGGPVNYKYAVTAVDTNGQEGQPSNVKLINGTIDLRTTPGTNEVRWTGVGGTVAAYNIYASSPSYAPLTAGDKTGLGFIGTISTEDLASTSFFDSNIAPDFSQTPPVKNNPFAGPDQVNPGCSSYFQQRLVYANGGGEKVATFWASKTGAYYNFDISNPSQANDSIEGSLVALEVNEIKSMIPMSTGLIALTSAAAWQINGGAGGVATQGGPITPTTATATVQAYVGANDVPPIVVNYDILFVQAKGSIVRDLTYNIYSNIYTGADISVLSSHMFYGHQILEWAYAEEPFKVVWCVREDGILLSLTLVKEQEMAGWARHDTLGNFKSVCTVTEGQTDATYFVVERPNQFGGIQRQIERLADRAFRFGAEDAWCVDCGVQSPDFFPSASLTVTAATGTVDVYVDVSFFLPNVVGAVIRAGGGIIKVTQYVTATQVVGQVVQPITELIPNDPAKRPEVYPPGTWTFTGPFTRVFGLDHLEGRAVSVLADGGVIHGMVVKDGTITLPAPATKVIAGLGFQAQLQTMPLDLGNELSTIQGKRKKVGALTVRVKDSRAIKAGRTFDTVTPIKELNRTTLMGLPITLITSDERIVMDPLWDVPGQICLQVDDPLPATVLGVIPEVVVGDSQK